MTFVNYGLIRKMIREEIARNDAVKMRTKLEVKAAEIRGAIMDLKNHRKSLGNSPSVEVVDLDITKHTKMLTDVVDNIKGLDVIIDKVGAAES